MVLIRENKILANTVKCCQMKLTGKQSSMSDNINSTQQLNQNLSWPQQIRTKFWYISAQRRESDSTLA